MSTTELNDAHEQIDADVAERAFLAAAETAIPVSPSDPELRTYRGKTLEELLPKIREELGPDAIVVRQRDGLMGGIGGFFQQQFVEVDARPGHPRIDVYDEAPEPAGEGFADLLAAAEADAEPTVEARASVEATVAPDAFPTDQSPTAESAPPVGSAPAVEAPALESAPPAETALSGESAPLAAPALPAEPAPVMEAPAPEATLAPTPPALEAPVVQSNPAPAPPTRDPLAALAESVREAALASLPPARKPPARRTAPPQGTATPVASEQLTATLAAQGLTEQLAAQLVAEAAAHELPFTGGDLRAATARALVRRIPTPPPHRAAGMAVAFVGPAGAGKTHAAAALAAAYAQISASVVVVTLCAKDGGAELKQLLAPFGVDVHAVASAAGARTRLRRASQDALVVLDTPAISPTDPTAIAVLAGQLAALDLDETQLVVPASMDPDAAHVMHERLAPLRPTGIALSHADDDTSLGAVVDLACASRLPLAYVATGGALASAIMPADPATIAERLLS